MSIKHLLSYIVPISYIGTSSEAFQKLLEMTSSNLKTERRTLQDIPANIFDRILAISFSEGFLRVTDFLICNDQSKPAYYSDIVDRKIDFYLKTFHTPSLLSMRLYLLVQNG